jgi:uncharacterized protein YaaQ
MKLVIAIIRDVDAEAVTQALTVAEFRVTRVASTGGLLRHGVVTLLLGVEAERVDAAIALMREKCAPAVPGQKRATVFVVPVDNFVQV